MKAELQKITVKYKRKCDNYILATNVPLSSVPDIGTHDKILQDVVPEFIEKIPHIHIWGYDDLCRFLDGYTEIRQSYLHFITPGDIIAELMDWKREKMSALADTVLLYVRMSFEKDLYAQLDQAGEIGEKPTPLRRVFIDLDVKPRSDKDLQAFFEKRAVTPGSARIFLNASERKESLSATEALISSNMPKTVLIGGPGQGKSTLSQFIAQIHRAHLLGKASELNGGNQKFVPAIVRVPFKIFLKDYAQWIVDSAGPHMLEIFLANLVEERAVRQISSEQIQEILKKNPTLLILDGLDEVTDRKLRTRMLEHISEFILRCEVLKADLQIIATSRPTGYSDQFDPSLFLHLTLITMDRDKVVEYTERWIRAKGLDVIKGNTLRSSIKDCLADPNFSPLMNTPLQVTIFILIILTGGTPPRQREELFDEYLEVIYKRERAKSKTIIQTEKRLLFGLHQYMGYLLHRRAAGSTDTRSKMKEEEFGEEVFRYLRYNDPYSAPIVLKQKAEQIILEAQERLVLLVGLETGVFGFELRSIQEFFAAGFLADTASDNRQRFERFHAIALPPHWHNVALFFAGRVGRCYPGEAAHILEACREIDRHKPDYYAKRGALLALEIAVDRSFGHNRILQRSTIEYSFTLLDGDLDREKRFEFVSRLRQLPNEDLQDHVVPLLLQRLEKTHLPDGFYNLEVFRLFSKDPSPIEQVISSAMEQGNVSSEILLEKSLEYRLPAAYINSKFSGLWANLSRNKIIDVLLPHFINDPQYVIEIWHQNGLPDDIAILMLFAAIETRMVKHYMVEGEIDFSVSPHIIDQIKLSFDLFMNMRQPYIEPDNSEFIYRGARSRFYTRFLEEPRYVTRDAFRERDYYVRNIPEISTKMIEQLAQIVVNPSAIIQLRATSLAFLYRLLLPSPKGRLIEETVKKFRTAINENEAEITDRILFLTGMPSLEGIQILSEIRARNKPPSLSDMTVRVSHALYSEKGKELNELLPISVLNPFNENDSNDIIGTSWLPKGVFKGFPLDILRLVLRLSNIPTYRTRYALDQKFVAKVIDKITKLLQKQGIDEWRAWAALSSLTSISWSKRNLFQRSDELHNNLALLCQTLDKRIDIDSGRWEIGGLLSRSAELEEWDTVRRILGILNRMSEVGLSERTRLDILHSIKIDQLLIDRILEIGVGSGEAEFCGFLKWYALYKSVEEYSPERETYTIKFDTDKVILIAERVRNYVREGALLLLGQSGAMSFEQTKRLLELSISDHKPVDRAWAALIKGTVKESDTQEAVDFLESILSKAARYPKAIKYAALEKYQQIARSTTVDISEQEAELGLPFQDINYPQQ
ncbi:MAG: hypothetical protein ABSH06_25705 [Thermodesulfobacteriota bacterium]